MTRSARSVAIATGIEIAARPEAVWRLLVDWERLDRWMLEARDFRLVGEQRAGEGVEAEATVTIAGVTTRDRIRVTRWDPPRLLEIAHLGWVTGKGTIELEPHGSGTRLRWEERFVPPWGVLGRIGMLALRSVMRRVFARDLRVLKRLAETGG